MSVEGVAAVWKYSKMTGTELNIMLCIGWHMKPPNTTSYPSIETIAKHCNVSSRTIKRLIKKCSEAGELCVDTNAGRGQANRYGFSFPVTKKVTNGAKGGVTNGAKKVTNGAKKVTNGAKKVTPLSPNKIDKIDKIDKGSEWAWEAALSCARNRQLPERDSLLWKCLKRYGWEKLRRLTDNQISWEKKAFIKIYDDEKRQYAH